MIQLLGRSAQRQELPRCPPDIADEVELYARASGRTATVHFVPFGGWFARFSLRSNDRRLILWQEGRAPEPPTEDVWFHLPIEQFDGRVHPAVPGQQPRPNERPRRDFIPLDIYQMGAGGVRAFLERGNTWSGRGEFSSIEDAYRKGRAAREASERKLHADAREDAGKIVMDQRRSRFKIPFLTVDVDLKGTSTGAAHQPPHSRGDDDGASDR